MLACNNEISDTNLRESDDSMISWLKQWKRNRSANRRSDVVLNSVPFVSSPEHVVKRMLKLANVKSDDIVYDLGCGDGRILIAAVESFGVKEAIGYEISEDVYKKALQQVAKVNLQERIRIINRDLFEADLSRANVITLYLNNFTNEKLRPKLEKQALPGTRIVSHDFSVLNWRPIIEDTFRDEYSIHTIYVYTVPGPYLQASART
jgi:SAM-dependent methyltransferase